MSCGSCDGTGNVCGDCGVGPFLCLCGGPQTALCQACKGLVDGGGGGAAAAVATKASEVGVPVDAQGAEPVGRDLVITSTLLQLVAAGGGFAVRQWSGNFYVMQVGPSGDRIPTDLTTLGVASYVAGCKVFHAPVLPNAGPIAAATRAARAAALKAAQDWIASEAKVRGQWQMNGCGDYVLTDVNRRFPIVPQHKRAPLPAKVQVGRLSCKKPNLK